MTHRCHQAGLGILLSLELREGVCHHGSAWGSSWHREGRAAVLGLGPAGWGLREPVSPSASTWVNSSPPLSMVAHSARQSLTPRGQPQ